MISFSSRDWKAANRARRPSCAILNADLAIARGLRFEQVGQPETEAADLVDHRQAEAAAELAVNGPGVTDGLAQRELARAHGAALLGRLGLGEFRIDPLLPRSEAHDGPGRELDGVLEIQRAVVLLRGAEVVERGNLVVEVPLLPVAAEHEAVHRRTEREGDANTRRQAGYAPVDVVGAAELERVRAAFAMGDVHGQFRDFEPLRGAERHARIVQRRRVVRIGRTAPVGFQLRFGAGPGESEFLRSGRELERDRTTVAEPGQVAGHVVLAERIVAAIVVRRQPGSVEGGTPAFDAQT